MEHNNVHCLMNLMMPIDSAVTDIIYAKVYKKVADSIQNHLKSSFRSLYSLLLLNGFSVEKAILFYT